MQQHDPESGRSQKRPPQSATRRGLKVAALFLLVTGGLVWGATVVAAVGVASQGLMRVSVHEKQPGGDDVSLYFPAAIVNVGLYLAPRFIPADAFGGADAELARFKPLIEGIVREIDRCPEGTLVEIRDGDELVEIALRGGALVVHVDSPAEEVDVVLPLSVLRAATWLLPDAPDSKVI